MREQEPMTLRQTRMLRMQAPDETHKGAGTCVRGQHRRREFAAERILRTILDRPGEETTVEIEDRCRTQYSVWVTAPTGKDRHSLISLIAKTVCLCIVSSADGVCNSTTFAPPKPGTRSDGGM